MPESGKAGYCLSEGAVQAVELALVQHLNLVVQSLSQQTMESQAAMGVRVSNLYYLKAADLLSRASSLLIMADKSHEWDQARAAWGKDYDVFLKGK